MKGALSVAVFVVVSVAAGCVDSSFPEGLACDGIDQSCPPGQRCFSQDGDMKCFSVAPIDAAVTAIDAPAAVDAAIDAAPAPACDLILQTGCEAGQSCYFRLDAQGGPFCATTGTVGTGPGAMCTAMTDCVRGAGCFADGMGMVCRNYCTDATVGTACRPLDVCESVEGDIGFCRFDGCDPLLQNCAPAEACYYDNMPMMGICRMTPGTAGEQGAACAMFDSCNKGFHCQICTGQDLCARYCNTDNGNADCADLPGAPACVGLPSAGNVGVCTACP